MKLVDNWKKAWKWFSMHCMAAAAAIQALYEAIQKAWISIPDDMKVTLSHTLVSGITIGLLVLGIFGRIVKQDKDQ